jgi:hypothetical protein
MNPTMYKEILKKFPEVVQLIAKFRELPENDLTYYRDNLLVALIVNTSKTDKEALGTLMGLILRLYEEVKILDKKRYG